MGLSDNGTAVNREPTEKGVPRALNDGNWLTLSGIYNFRLDYPKVSYADELFEVCLSFRSSKRKRKKKVKMKTYWC